MTPFDVGILSNPSEFAFGPARGGGCPHFQIAPNSIRDVTAQAMKASSVRCHDASTERSAMPAVADGEAAGLRGGTHLDLFRGSFGADLCRCGGRACDQTCEPMARGSRAFFGADVRIVDWPCDCCPDLSLGLRAIRALGGSRPFPPGPSPRHHHHTRPFSRAHKSLRCRSRFASGNYSGKCLFFVAFMEGCKKLLTVGLFGGVRLDS